MLTKNQEKELIENDFLTQEEIEARQFDYYDISTYSALAYDFAINSNSYYKIPPFIRTSIDWRLLDWAMKKCPTIYKSDGGGFIVKRGFDGWEYLSNLEY